MPVYNGTAGNDFIDASGIFPFDAADTLDGGAGADTMRGGDGSDLYIVDNVGDVIEESYSDALSGNDTVNASVSYTLSFGIDNLVLTGFGAISGTGNDLDNSITGNDGSNTLTGLGGNDTLIGAGSADTLIGGDGNDVLRAGFFTDLVQAGAGDDVIEVLNGEFYDSVDGGDGFDTLDHSQSSYNGSTFNFLTGQLTGSGVSSTATLASIEVYRDGSGSNTIVASGTGHAYFGNAGNDTLRAEDGGTAVDTLDGGTGSDTYFVDNGVDAIVETEVDGGAIDTVNASVTRTLGANLERLTLTGDAAIDGTGNELDNLITGNAAANLLDGGTGSDTLVGGGGNDTLTGAGLKSASGGEGDDWIIDSVADGGSFDGENGFDVIDLSGATLASRTIDLDQATLTIAGGSYVNFEGVIGTTAAEALIGNADANLLGGHDGDDTLVGGAGDDTLAGGAGGDLMSGGAGSDQYTVDSANDTVHEGTGLAGTDTVIASISYTLGSGLENLTIAGGVGRSAKGNAAANTLTGAAGNDTLDGAAGADAMTGGDGNDTYVVDNAGDQVNETATSATQIDTVRSTLAFTLGSNLENLVLTGTSAINGTGNTRANTLTGNSAVNTLNGLAGNDTLDGGGGADSLVGGTGNDTYVVNVAGDKTVEAGTSLTEIDLVRAGLSWTLAVNVEQLLLTGTGAFNGTGNTRANLLTGNNAANTLLGLDGRDTLNGAGGNDVLDGGTGNDSLVGGTGLDTFRFSTTLNATSNVDAVSGFVRADDRFLLDDAVFAGVGAVGALALGAFRTGTAALERDDRIIYNKAQGKIYFDADGFGGATQVLFATVAINTDIRFDDFFIG
jgi:Ca2+-binding RTX toxin-like protein